MSQPSRFASDSDAPRILSNINEMRASIAHSSGEASPGPLKACEVVQIAPYGGIYRVDNLIDEFPSVLIRHSARIDTVFIEPLIHVLRFKCPARCHSIARGLITTLEPCVSPR